MEVAIILPLLLLLTVGAFEIGRGVWTKHVLTNAAREAARYAAVRSVTSDDPATADKVKTRAKDAAVGLDTGALVVQTSWQNANVAGNTVRVSVTYSFHPATPLVPVKTIEMTSSSQRVIVN
jgi:Flp pilus assembly protein TadG